MKLIIKEEKRLREQDVEIEVKNKGILEVPEGKNVDDLPMSHFEKLVKKHGLSKITKALNNLQVWNKNDDPKLSKWAGNMIDKLTKKYGKNESLNLEEDSIDDLVIPEIKKRYIWPLYEDSVYEISEIIEKYQNTNRFKNEIKSFDLKDISYRDWPVLQLEIECSYEAYVLIRKDIEREGLYMDDDEFDECVSESVSLEENELDDWYESIPKQLRDVAKEMEKLGWEGVGFTTTGVEYCISKEDKNRPELSYEMCVTIHDRDDSVYISKYVDIFDWDKEKEVSSIPNTSGVTEFRTPQDVRKFTQWFRRLGTSFSTKESVKVRNRKQTMDEGVTTSLLTIKGKGKLAIENVCKNRKRRK